MAKELPDLQKILRRLQRRYFPEHKALPTIVWKYPGRVSTSYVLFGLYRADEKFIYINWALSASWVPDYFLEMVIYHEYCHFLQDVYPLAGETAHSDRFKEWEQRHPAFEKSAKWEARNLEKVLREGNRLAKKLYK